jgi:hypothetical protein
MNIRSTVILFLVLVVLAATATLMEKNRKSRRSPTGDLLFPALQADKVDAIDLRAPDEDVQLEKDGEEWKVRSEGGYPADPKLISSILDSFGGLRNTEVSSTRPDRHATFEADSSGVIVKLSGGGNSLAWLYVGKAGPDYLSTYVRPVDDEKVYRVPVYLRSIVDRGKQTWRDRNIVALDESKIAGYTTMTPRDTVAVERGEAGSWRLTKPVEADANSDVMGVVVRSLASIRASAFADSIQDLASVGLEPDTMSLQIRTTDGSNYTIDVGAENDKRQTYTKRADSPIVYLVPKGRWPAIFRSADELQKPKSVEGGAPVVTPAG